MKLRNKYVKKISVFKDCEPDPSLTLYLENKIFLSFNNLNNKNYSIIIQDKENYTKELYFVDYDLALSCWKEINSLNLITRKYIEEIQI